MRSCRLKFLATAAVFAGVVAFAFTGSPAFAAPDVVEGVEIDANIEYDTDGDFDWGSEDPSHLANCLIDETPFPLDSPTGVCTGEPGAVLIQDPTSAKGAIDPNIHKGGDKLTTRQGAMGEIPSPPFFHRSPAPF